MCPDQFIRESKKPRCRHPNARITLMDEIFLRKPNAISSKPVFPKFLTYNDYAQKTDVNIKRIILINTSFCINICKEPKPPQTVDFLFKRDSMQMTSSKPNLERRRSSWSLMKHLIKGLNRLKNPQVLFIKNEVYMFFLIKLILSI